VTHICTVKYRRVRCTAHIQPRGLTVDNCLYFYAPTIFLLLTPEFYDGPYTGRKNGHSIGARRGRNLPRKLSPDPVSLPNVGPIIYICAESVAERSLVNRIHKSYPSRSISFTPRVLPLPSSPPINGLKILAFSVACVWKWYLIPELTTSFCISTLAKLKQCHGRSRNWTTSIRQTASQ
jgi:hypothetical protein